MAKAPTERWRWYGAKTSDCVWLDPKSYPSTVFDHRPLPWPAWACKAPDGGVHIDDRVGRVDIRVAEAPNSRDEINFTCDFQVEIVAKRWLSSIEDLIDGRSVFSGNVYAGGAKLGDWATLHAPGTPPLCSTDMRSQKRCPICGTRSAVLRGSFFFTDSAVAGRPLIVNRNGIFVHEDECLRRGLRTPVGAFRPIWVKLQPELTVDSCSP